MKVVCNLKAHKTWKEYREYIADLSKLDTNHELIVAPSFPYLAYYPKNITLCAQDVSFSNHENIVGNVTAKQLKSLDVRYCLVGHSSRRIHYDENEKQFKQKIGNCLENDIKVIYCVGESREEKQREKTYQVIEKQIARIFNNFEGDLNNIIIAYEPIWAISENKKTTDSVDLAKIRDIVIFIKKIILDYYDININVLYGGSIDEDIVGDYLDLEIDGFLIGNASLDVEKVSNILNKI